MKVARKHIITAVEDAGRLKTFPKYMIKAKPYVGTCKRVGEFGWKISVLPRSK